METTGNSNTDIIIKRLAQGETRDEIAESMGYKNWRSLDIYMRRKGMIWSSDNYNYIYPLQTEDEEEFKPDTTSRTAYVISLFTQKKYEPKEIAKMAGFESHRELASYMASQSYSWSSEKNNYIKSCKIIDIGKSKIPIHRKEDTQIKNSIPPSIPEKYISLLEMLYKYKHQLKRTLYNSSDTEMQSPDEFFEDTAPVKLHITKPLMQSISDFCKKHYMSINTFFELSAKDFINK